jgi:ribosomal 50S subunit-recycling heat shock protein
VRLDKFLQVSRLIKRREVANRLCDHGRVRLNGAPARPAAAVRPGDIITISQGARRLVAKVAAVPERAAPSRSLVEILARTAVDEWHG